MKDPSSKHKYTVKKTEDAACQLIRESECGLQEEVSLAVVGKMRKSRVYLLKDS